MVRRWRLALAVFSLAGLTAAFAQPAAPVQQTIPGNGNAPALSAYWFASNSGAAAKKPVVIGLHGCGGALDAKGKLTPQWARHAAQFNAEGIHFLALDSFSGRGLKSICETAFAQRAIGNEDRRGDAQAALRWLATQPGVDTQRMAVVGWSNGAQAVLSLMDASANGATPPPLPLAAVAFYPGCRAFAGQTGGYVLQPGVPLLVMIGALDDWTPAATCERLQAALQKPAPAPPPFELVVYADSYHGFDSPSAVRIRQGLATPSGTAHVGGNRAAWEASHTKLFDFLLAQFGQTAALSHADRFALTGR